MTASNATMDSSPDKQSDMLLWFAAAAVVGIGLVWLLISQPWSTGVSEAPAAALSTPASTAAPTAAPAPSAAPASDGRQSLVTSVPEGGSALANPLRMAELAYEAGMLIEPDDYSAWALYSRALEEDPDSAAARDGLNKVAEDLLKRGSAAIEQGRFDDARATVRRVVSVLPNHEGAEALSARIEKLAPQPTPRPSAAPSREPSPSVEASRSAPAAPVAPAVIEQAKPEPQIDLIEKAHAAFRQAMVENRLLTPIDDSARHYVEEMVALQPDHDLTRGDRELLVTELLARSTQALEALDTEAARTWIDEAEKLADDPAPVAAAHERMADTLVALESAKRLPVSTLTVVNYVPPEYSRIALTRGIEGWVDVEFTVAADGTTRDIEVTDASHSSYFRQEAVDAVAQWRFEPRVFMDRPIAQQTYARLRFVLNE